MCPVVWLMKVFPKLPRSQFYYITHKGFTLIELMVVIAILTVVVLMTLPSFRGYLLEQRLDATAMELASDIRHLQQLALTEESVSYGITFYLPNRNKTGNKYYIHKGINKIKLVYMPPGVKISSTSFDENLLNINAKGMPEDGIGGTVYLHDEHNRISKQVIVATITGRVRVSENGPIKPWGYVQ